MSLTEGEEGFVPVHIHKVNLVPTGFDSSSRIVLLEVAQMRGDFCLPCYPCMSSAHGGSLHASPVAAILTTPPLPSRCVRW